MSFAVLRTTKGCTFGNRFFFINGESQVSSATAVASPQQVHSGSQNHEPRRKFYSYSRCYLWLMVLRLGMNRLALRAVALETEARSKQKRVPRACPWRWFGGRASELSYLLNPLTLIYRVTYSKKCSRTAWGVCLCYCIKIKRIPPKKL